MSLLFFIAVCLCGSGHDSWGIRLHSTSETVIISAEDGRRISSEQRQEETPKVEESAGTSRVVAGPIPSPDGTGQAFTVTRVDMAAKNSRILIFDTQANTSVAIRKEACWDKNPSWTPNGKQVYFYGGIAATGKHRLMKYDVEKQSVEVVDEEEVCSGGPIVVEDELILYTKRREVEVDGTKRALGSVVVLNDGMPSIFCETDFVNDLQMSPTKNELLVVTKGDVKIFSWPKGELKRTIQMRGVDPDWEGAIVAKTVWRSDGLAIVLKCSPGTSSAGIEVTEKLVIAEWSEDSSDVVFKRIPSDKQSDPVAWVRN